MRPFVCWRSVPEWGRLLFNLVLVLEMSSWKCSSSLYDGGISTCSWDSYDFLQKIKQRTKISIRRVGFCGWVCVFWVFFSTEENSRVQEIMFGYFLSILLLLIVIYTGILLCEHQLPKHFHLIHAGFPERAPENHVPTENDCNKDCHLKTVHINTDQRPMPRSVQTPSHR